MLIKRTTNDKRHGKKRFSVPQENMSRTCLLLKVNMIVKEEDLREHFQSFKSHPKRLRFPFKSSTKKHKGKRTPPLTFSFFPPQKRIVFKKNKSMTIECIESYTQFMKLDLTFLYIYLQILESNNINNRDPYKVHLTQVN